jgi:hypothetical protein
MTPGKALAGEGFVEDSGVPSFLNPSRAAFPSMGAWRRAMEPDAANPTHKSCPFICTGLDLMCAMMFLVRKRIHA